MIFVNTLEAYTEYMIGVIKTTKSLTISIIFAFFVVTFVCDNDLHLNTIV